MAEVDMNKIVIIIAVFVSLATLMNTLSIATISGQITRIGSEFPFDNVEVTSSETLPPYVTALWHLDEGVGNIAHDETANNNDGTISGAVWVTGISGTALQIDNIDGYVNVADSDSLTFNNGNFTIEASFKLSENHQAGSSNKWIIIKNGEYGLYLDGIDGYLKFYIASGDGIPTSYKVSNTNFWQAGVWYHVAGVYENGNTWKIYINGNLDATGNQPYFTNVQHCIFDIGTISGCTFPHDNFVGIIDEVRVSGVALQPSEFLLFQQEPTCSDGIQNGDEEGVDCGGSCPNVCPLTLEERVEILEGIAQNHEERIDILEIAVDGLIELVNSMQQVLIGFIDLITSYLSNLPMDLRTRMICGHMLDNNVTNYSDLGLTCTLNATVGCVCERENPMFVTTNQTG